LNERVRIVLYAIALQVLCDCNFVELGRWEMMEVKPGGFGI
jgi:hypothetical protein